MLKIENVSVTGWEAALRGMRNPLNSWEKSDTECAFHAMENFTEDDPMAYKYREWNDKYGMNIKIGKADYTLMMNLCKGGTEESKWRRMIHVTFDMTAPLYLLKEFDVYKVGTTSNSCSTMHKIAEREFTLDDFSCEHLLNTGCNLFEFTFDNGMFSKNVQPLDFLQMFIIPSLNVCRNKYLETKDKSYWWQMIQLLPSSYNQRRTVDLNYEVLAAQYRQRKAHKLDEWVEYCKWIKTLPYSEFITGEKD